MYKICKIEQFQVVEIKSFQSTDLYIPNIKYNTVT